VTAEAAEPGAWYGCYGSNLALARFRCYLEGGRPLGSSRSQPGCRDTSPPTGDRPVTLPGQVHFAHHAPSWGGAVAFLDLDAPATSPGRAYRITAPQLADVVAQENGRRPGAVSLDLAEVGAGGRVEVCPGWYGTVAWVGEVDDEPLLTITSAWALSDVAPAAPSAAYLRTIGDGLAEAHGWTPTQAAAHLHRCPGVAPAWTPDALVALLAG
jgi:hypothetical protein